MAEGHSLHNLLSKETAGLPNWAWLLVVAAGLAAAYLIPKFIGGQGSASGGDQGTASGDIPTSPSGVGLAVDPTTGLPYAVSGLVPSGANAGITTPPPPPPQTPPPATTTPTPPPASQPQKWYTIPKWPNNKSGTFQDIASKFGISVDRLYQLNPQINKNAKLDAGWTIRIA
jgi:hypothetical protein